MMMTKTAAPSLVLLVCLASIWDGLLYNHGGVHGFTTTSSLSVGTMISSSSSLSSTVGGRRSFLETSVVMTTSVLFFPLVVAPPPVLAADTDSVDDLSMPTEEEIQKSEADAIAERLRRKAELQKQNAKPLTFTENLKAEKEKQKSLQKSKEERRNALCEELGRGC